MTPSKLRFYWEQGCLNFKLSEMVNLGDIKNYMIQMLEAVQFIHRRRIIHADIKPDNFIMVRGHLKVQNVKYLVISINIGT